MSVFQPAPLPPPTKKGGLTVQMVLIMVGAGFVVLEFVVLAMQ